MLPFGADRQVIVDLGRYRTMTTQQATSLLPLFSDWKGAASPRVTLLSRNRQVMGIDLFESSTNYNAVIAAQSGSGKSFFANDLICAVPLRCETLGVFALGAADCAYGYG